MENKEIVKLVNAKWVHQIRAGEKHRFIDITIVEIEGRFFVRQYKFGKRSWYDAFINDPNGAIKINDKIIPIRAIKPSNLGSVNKLVNKAYFKKMNILYWLMRLTYDRQKHEASTLELIPQI